jgi:hypothetical protein
VTIPAGLEVRLDTDVQVGGVNVQGELYFDPASSVTMRSNANIVVTGLLHMQPSSPSADHVIEFSDVNEGRFQGGGMQVLASDVGLWVMNTGQVRLEGSAKRGWTNAAGSVAAGARTIQVDDATGWQVGDRVAITPTGAPGSDGLNDGEGPTAGFHETTVTAVSGNSVSLAEGPARSHPQVAGRYTAEVANLTRNVEIRGTTAGNSHMMVHAMANPQLIRWVSFDMMGVSSALGRYPLHFHHAGSGSAGSLVEGVVVQNGEHHAFVPHESQGITFRDIVAYNTSGGDAVWWDEGEETGDVLFDRALVAGSANSAFYLGRGTNMTVRNSVAVGVRNNATDGGFEWENGATGNWTVGNIVAHNNISSGVRVWQNSSIPQVIDGYVAYHNYAAAVDQGAYGNRYTYRNGHYYGNQEAGLILWATGQPTPISFENTVIDSAGVTTGPHVRIGESAIPAARPVTFIDVEFRGQAGGSVFSFTDPVRAQARCVDCTLPQGTSVVTFPGNRVAGTWLEVIDSGQSVRYNPNGSTTNIPRPVPTTIGDGIGLTAEYFNNPDLTDLGYETILPGLTDAWELDPAEPSLGVPPPHHSMSVEDGSSARLTGQLEVPAGEGGRHTFRTSFNGGIRLWIDGTLLIDDWGNASGISPADNQASVDLGAGRHDIRVELTDSQGQPGPNRLFGWYFDVFWSNGGDAEIVPPHQLFPARIPNNDPTPFTG